MHKLTLFKEFLASGPKRFTLSIARNRPTPVTNNTFRTGITATTNRSRNPILPIYGAKLDRKFQYV